MPPNTHKLNNEFYISGTEIHVQAGKGENITLLCPNISEHINRNQPHLHLHEIEWRRCPGCIEKEHILVVATNLPGLEWNSKYESTFPHDRASFSLPDGHLTITNLQYEDGGTYLCTVTHNHVLWSKTRLLVGGMYATCMNLTLIH